jgi:cardiolipin synthase A/B
MVWKRWRWRPKLEDGKRRVRWRVVGIIVLLAEILGVLSAVDAVMNSRTSQGSIAWAVSLVTFPYVSVPAYWVFGRNKFNGYVSAHREGDLLIDSVGTRAVEAARQYVVEEPLPSAAVAAVRLARLPFLRGNAVELLIDGDATFTSILEGIDSAEDYILFQFFIVKDDQIGREFQAALIRKARQGVRVYFLYDEVGSHRLSNSYKDELREAGVRVFNFHTRQGPKNRFQVNFRNHRKVVVVDGRVSWIGGLNIGDEYLGRDPKFGHWRDTHLRIEGPATLGAQLSFVEDWNWAAGESLDLDWLSYPAPDGSDTPILIIPSGPADRFETATLMFTHAISSATERIWIASPYFVPDEGIIAALQLAGLRGVDVRILIPDVADHTLVYLAAFTYFDEAMTTGVKFYKYTGGFLHEKVMLIDDRAAGVGTANFDNRSFRLNFEITALIADTAFVEQVERMFEADFAQSRIVPSDEYSSRGFWFRLAARLARLTAPIQ